MDAANQKEDQRPGICILTGVTDDHYRSQRSDNPVVCTSASKRAQLYKAIRAATGVDPFLLSPHSRGLREPTHLPAMETGFGEFRQLFSAASGIRKLRFIVDKIRYADCVYKNTRDGDVLIFDNYELVYVLAIYYCRVRGRFNPVILEYEDGKHEIDRGWVRWISSLAEFLGRRLIDAAIVATPALLERLPDQLPTVIVPGLLSSNIVFNPAPPDGDAMHFLYSGSLDAERGIPLLLDYLGSVRVCENTVYHITGQGSYSEQFIRLMEQHPGRIHFHGCVTDQELDRIRRMCHYGLNLQCSSNPISRVTYPSKTFDYLNAGLRVVSTRTGCVEDVLGAAAIYLEAETVDGLAAAVGKAVNDISTTDGRQVAMIMENHSFDGTARRLRRIFEECNPQATRRKA
jgi:glycosyltransferase involved in cell wall biosynthesis